MKFGRKPLVLIGSRNNVISNRFRYKFVQSAVRRSMALPVPFVQIWNLQTGREIGTVHKTRKTITVRFL